MGNGERGMRLTIFHKILHSEQFEGAEFIDDNSFLWFLTPHLSSSRPKFWTKNGKCFNFDEVTYSEQIEGGEFNGDNSFCNFWCLSILTPVNVGNCHLLGHSFGRRTTNASILMKLRTLRKVRVVNSIVTIVFCDSRRLPNLTPVNIGTCHLLGHSFRPKTANVPVLMKFCTLHKTRVVNSMASILRDASGFHRELKLGIEKQILRQKYYYYNINKTGKKNYGLLP